MALAPLCACKAAAEAETLPPPTVLEAPGCGSDGALEGSLVGGIETSINWSADDMVCESMPRPNGEGLRLRFSGEVSGERLAIIIAMPGLVADQSGVEIPSNVTLTVEGSGRFFSTPSLATCWTEIDSQTALPDEENSYAVLGRLFCIAPLGEVNGDAAVSIPELSFSTIIRWKSQ